MDITSFNNLHKSNKMFCIYKSVIHYSVWQGYTCTSSATETGAATASTYTEGTQCELGTTCIHRSGSS